MKIKVFRPDFKSEAKGAPDFEGCCSTSLHASRDPATEPHVLRRVQPRGPPLPVFPFFLDSEGRRQRD